MSIIYLLGVFLLSCEPKDQFIPLPNKGSGSPAVTKMNAEELNKLLASSLDKLPLSLALIRSVLDDQYSESLKITKSQVDETDHLFKKSKKALQLSSQKTLSFESVEHAQSVNQVLESFDYNEQNQITVLRLKKAPKLTETFLSKKNGVDFNSKTKTSDIVLVKLTDVEDRYLLTLHKNEITNSKKDKMTEVETHIEAVIVWDGKLNSLSQDINVVALSVEVERRKNKEGQLKFIDNEASLSVSLGVLCTRLDGVLKLRQSNDDRLIVDPSAEPLILDIKDSEVAVRGTSFVSEPQNCEVRPLIDLTRML